MSPVTRMVGAVAVTLVAVLGLLALSQSVAAFTRESNCRSVAAEAKLVEETAPPEIAPGLCSPRARTVEVPRRRPELIPALLDDAPAVTHPSPAGDPEAPHGALRRCRAAALQVFRC
ncbi:hypothetical protein BX285_4313 [Streptomyces sp. 1114.5]|uniref:hypothetical protein n=1 Tax=unclassified Streptomyces TaxID=2593676 RepID=UPI000BC5B133|nr:MULTISPECIES: hypothetical protein [unclassified Streptomyces]RKT19843.1 hypothetical protein BX285_4313 [Streptomyces sp. 1114.5]SOB86042.1 hypothetical protein SAMN06272789_6344 [Streptomyces sp. 1331.2]